jgi:hypothetical protein
LAISLTLSKAQQSRRGKRIPRGDLGQHILAIACESALQLSPPGTSGE